jgi:hypothetical protein
MTARAGGNNPVILNNRRWRQGNKRTLLAAASTSDQYFPEGKLSNTAITLNIIIVPEQEFAATTRIHNISEHDICIIGPFLIFAAKKIAPSEPREKAIQFASRLI